MRRDGVGGKGVTSAHKVSKKPGRDELERRDRSYCCQKMDIPKRRRNMPRSLEFEYRKHSEENTLLN